MNLWQALRDYFQPAPPPSSLRNRAGGLARVRLPFDPGNGSYAIHGHFVKTVRLDGPGFWVVDPPLQFIARTFVIASNERMAWPGDPVLVVSMHDDLLEPIRDVGEEERDESLRYLPPVPTSTKQGATA